MEAWNMHGICMEYAWNMHGICMEYAWKGNGRELDSLTAFALQRLILEAHA